MIWAGQCSVWRLCRQTCDPAASSLIGSVVEERGAECFVFCFFWQAGVEMNTVSQRCLRQIECVSVLRRHRGGGGYGERAGRSTGRAWRRAAASGGPAAWTAPGQSCCWCWRWAGPLLCPVQRRTLEKSKKKKTISLFKVFSTFPSAFDI